MREGYLGGSSSFFKFHVCPAVHISLTSPSRDAQPSRSKAWGKCKERDSGGGSREPIASFCVQFSFLHPDQGPLVTFACSRLSCRRLRLMYF